MAVAARKPTSRTRSTPRRPAPVRTHRDPEAPDRGDRDREAPEHRPDGRQAEAPDAGEGRMSTLEHEFTHGRSQS